MAPPASTNQGVLFASGLTAPLAGNPGSQLVLPADGTPGYQTGCIFQVTNGAGGATAYINQGTYAACDFDAIVTTGPDEPSPVIADLNGNIGAIKGTSLAIGASGSEVALTATIAQLNALAAIPVSLGSTTSFVVGTAAPSVTLIAANASKNRGVLVVVHIDAAFTNATGVQPTLTVGDVSNPTKAFAALTFVSATLGQVFVTGFANATIANTNNIVATWTAGTLTATGAATVTVIALPNS